MKKYALLVGVEGYRDQMISPLRYARADARVLAERLRDRCNFDHVRVLADESGEDEPLLVNIVTALRDTAGELRQEDLFLFFFAGHGVEKDGHGYLLARDSIQAFPEHGSLSLELLRKTFGGLIAGKRILLLDACRNSPQAGRSDADNPMGDVISRDIVAAARATEAAGTTTALLSACRSGQRAYEWPARGHGVFTQYLVEGIDGVAWTGGELDFNQLAGYAARQVRQWSANTPGLPMLQEPWYEQFGDPEAIVLASGTCVARSVPKSVVSLPRQREKAEPNAINRAAVWCRSHQHCVAATLIATVVVVTGFWTISMWHTANRTAIHHAQRLIEQGKPTLALEQLHEQLVLPWNRGAYRTIDVTAQRLVDLRQASDAAETGDIAHVQQAIVKRPEDQDFKALLVTALRVAAPQQELLARRHINEKNYSAVVSICSLYHEHPPFDVILADAQTQALADALSRVETGDLLWVESIAALFPKSEELADCVEKARLVRDRSDRLSEAKIAADKGDIQATEAVTRQYANDAEFAKVLQHAREVAKRNADVTTAEDLAKAGEVEKVATIAAQYPSDHEFSQFVLLAKRTRLRTEKLAEARMMAAKGDVDPVKQIAGDYPDDAEFGEAVKNATQIQKRRQALNKTAAAVRSLDLVTAVSLAKQYSGDTEFEQNLKSIRFDGDYAFLLGAELDEVSPNSNTKRWVGKRVKICGTITEIRTVTSSGSITWIKIASLDPGHTFWLDIDWSWPKRGYFANGDRLTCWGVFSSSWGGTVGSIRLLAKGKPVRMANVEQEIKIATAALDQGDPKPAGQTLKRYLNANSGAMAERAAKVSKDIEDRKAKEDRNRRFSALPRRGEYVLMTWEGIVTFSDLLQRKKIEVTGTVLSNGSHASDYFETSFVVDGSKGKGKMRARWRQPATRGLSYSERRSKREAFVTEMNQFTRGTRWKLAGLFEVESGLFSTTLRVDPVERSEAVTTPAP